MTNTTIKNTDIKEAWDQLGFVVIRNMIPQELIQDFLEQLQDSRKPTIKALCEGLGVVSADQIPKDLKHYRFMDLHNAGAAKIIANFPALKNAVSACFGLPSTCSQSLSFEWPSEQGIHQDWPYVTTVNNNRYMAGVWVACDPVTEENGPLFYHPKSHKTKRYAKNNPKDNQREFESYLRVAAKDFPTEYFLAQPGDVLIWDGDLMHGGSKAKNPDLLRRSLILHYTVEGESNSFMNRFLKSFFR